MPRVNSKNAKQNAKNAKGQIFTMGTLNGRELNVVVNYVTVPDEIAFATGTLTAKVDDNNRTMRGSLLFIGEKNPLQLKLTRR